MITDFDKTKVSEYMKEKFIEAFRSEEYEKAVDYLLKYSELTDYPEFHLAMGELYLLMTQDSDDIDLCFLAYREFLMHIRRFPKCEAAYRGLLATEFLRRDYPDVEEYRRWMEKRGINVVEVFKSLSKAGLVLPITNEPVDLYELILQGELGALDPLAIDDEERQSEQKPDGAVKKIIPFRGKGGAEDGVGAEKSVQIEQRKMKSIVDGDKRKSKIINFGEKVDGDEFDDETRAALDDFIRFVSKIDDEYGDEDIESIDEAMLDIIAQSDDKPNDDVIKLAGEMYDKRIYDEALKILAHVNPTDPQYYYALTLRGVVLLERAEGEDPIDALNTLYEALRIKPGGAIASTLLCQAYEMGKMTQLIPTVLKEIDNTDFVNSAHVYKAFDLAIEYCTREDAEDLIEQYIDEYNLMDMRLMYAQMRYNDGDRANATNELYKLSRINYDDIHYNFFYLSTKLDVDKVPEEAEAPQAVLSAVVENLMDVVADNDDFSTDGADSDLFSYGLEFFFTLEFRNSKKTLKRMFETLEKIAKNPVFEDRARDALISPYAEPIVKGVILSELFSRDHNTDFLVQVMHKHYSEDSIETPKSGYGNAVYRAYGMLLGLCPPAAPSVTKLSDKLVGIIKELSLTERQEEYYLVKRTLKDRGISPDYRLAYAMGFKTKSEADRIYSLIDKKI